MKKSTIAIGIGLFALLGLTGCGGTSLAPGAPSGPSIPTGRGTVAFTVAWPARTSRLIPQAANSLKIVVKDSAGNQVDSRIVTRPTGDVLDTHVEIGGLEPGQKIFTVTAHPGASADGVAQASGQVALDIVSGQTTSARLRLDSTIDQLVLSQTTADIRPGRFIALTATPYNSAGEIVIVSTTWQWTNSNPGAISLTTDKGQAILRPGVGSGSGTVTVRDTESGKSATCTVSNRVGTSNLDYGTYTKIENVVDETANLVIDGNDADWVNIPAYADSSDSVADATRNITSSSLVATPDAFYIRIRTASSPSTSATKTYWAGLDIANTYQAADIELGFSADGTRTQLRYLQTVGGTVVSGEFDLPPSMIKYGSVLEAKIPYAILKPFLPANLAAALDSPRPMVRMIAKTVDPSTNPVTVLDRGSVTGTYLIRATPYTLDPDLPAAGSAPLTMRVPADGRWYISQGGFSDSNGQGFAGVGTSLGAWSLVLDKRDNAGLLSTPDASVVNTNYFGWNQALVAPLASTVTSVDEGRNDILPLSNPASSNPANFLQLNLGGGLNLVLQGFQKNGITPGPAASVAEGAALGVLGTSGWVNWPQLGLILRDTGGTTYPIAFKNVRICLSPIAADPWERQRASWDAREGFYVEKQ